jgi:LPXTG-site transpeptidase (sortase) family protein
VSPLLGIAASAFFVSLAAWGLVTGAGQPAPIGSVPAATTASAPPTASASPRSSDAPIAVASAAASAETLGGPIASGYRITIPRLGIDLPIAEGDVKRDIEEQHTLENYAFHLPGTATPGQNGNMYLYAHARTGMFLSLWNARAGDEVFVWAPDGQLFVYVVRDILSRVVPTDVSSTRPTTTERLTLQTSTGPSAADPRFVVFAFLRGS